MNSPKLENMLNLALDATEEEREKSLNLNIGFDQEEKTWELIVKYSGDLTSLRQQGATVAELQNGYAILHVPESQIERLSAMPQIEYVEKPKRLFFSVDQGRTAACITGVQNAQYDLFGDGVLVAVLDSGVDYTHPDFRNEDGSSRILALWDQTIPGNPPTGYAIGTEYTKEELDEALLRYNAGEGRSLVPSVDNSGHGTRVLGIAAGNGRASNGRFRGVASRSPLLVVKLGLPRGEAFPRTTELMQGLDYCLRKAMEWQLPVAVNISFGNTYGPHNGTSLLETYITNLANVWKSVICIGTGNEGYAAGHTAGVLGESGPGGSQMRVLEQDIFFENTTNYLSETQIELAVGEYEAALNVQIWKSYLDDVDFMLTSPGGQMVGPIQQILGPQRFFLEETEILLFYGEPSPYSQSQEIYIEFLPRQDYVTTGIWTFTLVPRQIRDGRYEMWLPSAAALNGATRFLRPQPDNTLTIPSTAPKIISVAAYDSRRLTYADFSGRGKADWELLQKPDLAAPGVDIVTTVPGGGYGEATGTSFATPFVTGAAALLMQWGITDGNDPFLYGEKVKTYLQKGARTLPGLSEYPNPQIGWGTLCVRESLPD